MSTNLARLFVIGGVLVVGATACAPAGEDEELGGATSNLDRSSHADERTEHARREPTAREKLRAAYLTAYRRAATADFQDFRAPCQSVDIGRPITPDDEIWRWHVGLDPEIRRGLQIGFPAKTTGPLYALLVETVVGSEVEMHLFPEGQALFQGCAAAHPLELLTCRFAKGSTPEPSECTITPDVESEQRRARSGS